MAAACGKSTRLFALINAMPQFYAAFQHRGILVQIAKIVAITVQKAFDLL